MINILIILLLICGAVFSGLYLKYIMESSKKPSPPAPPAPPCPHTNICDCFSNQGNCCILEPWKMECVTKILGKDECTKGGGKWCPAKIIPEN